MSRKQAPPSQFVHACPNLIGVLFVGQSALELVVQQMLFSSQQPLHVLEQLGLGTWHAPFSQTPELVVQFAHATAPVPHASFC
jgi:hypothetical protein